MTDISYYDAELPAIQAIVTDAIKKPTMPIQVAVQEAENLYSWAQDDKAALTAAGLDWSLVESLLSRAGALREAESRWYKERFQLDDAQQQWDQRSPEAYALRDKLLRDMRFAFRRDEALLKRVAGIAEGNGNADMLQDLSDLASLGRDYTDALAKIGVDAAELDRAVALADEMSHVLAEATRDRKLSGSARVIRDQAYTHLKQAVDEIRDTGQYAFWNDGVRRDGYISTYLRKKNSRRNTASSPITAETTPDA